MPGKRRLISNFSRSYFLLVNTIRLVLDIFFTDICFSIPVRNKFCFTGGIFEASVQLPGANNVVGMWPAIWTMGNLGRAGYGSTLEGMVRLSNNLPSPTIDRSGLIHPDNDNSGHIHMTPATSVQLQIKQPIAAMQDGDHLYNNVLSYLPGQRLSRCTCNGEDHPGPKHADGTYVGRSAPEIDMFEAQMGGKPLSGEVSQSAQFAVNYR